MQHGDYGPVIYDTKSIIIVSYNLGPMSWDACVMIVVSDILTPITISLWRASLSTSEYPWYEMYSYRKNNIVMQVIFNYVIFMQIYLMFFFLNYSG